MPHTRLEAGTVGPAVLVCGDPARATYIASFLNEAVLLAESREYRSYQGGYHGRTLTICSHGIGAPGAAIAFEELIATGAKTIIRVGTCGGIQPDIQAGEVVIATAAEDNTGYGCEVVPPGYPAVADPTVTMALWQVAKGVRPSHLGLVLSRDAFYGGVATPFAPDYQTMAQANVLAVEMECAALFLVGSLRKVRTGAILAVSNSVFQAQESIDSFQPQTEAAQQAIDEAIQIALAALVEFANEPR